MKVVCQYVAKYTHRQLWEKIRDGVNLDYSYGEQMEGLLSPLLDKGNSVFHCLNSQLPRVVWRQSPDHQDAVRMSSFNVEGEEKFSDVSKIAIMVALLTDTRINLRVTETGHLSLDAHAIMSAEDNFRMFIVSETMAQCPVVSKYGQVAENVPDYALFESALIRAARRERVGYYVCRHCKSEQVQAITSDSGVVRKCRRCKHTIEFRHTHIFAEYVRRTYGEQAQIQMNPFWFGIEHDGIILSAKENPQVRKSFAHVLIENKVLTYLI